MVLTSVKTICGMKNTKLGFDTKLETKFQVKIAAQNEK